MLGFFLSASQESNWTKKKPKGILSKNAKSNDQRPTNFHILFYISSLLRYILYLFCAMVKGVYAINTPCICRAKRLKTIFAQQRQQQSTYIIQKPTHTHTHNRDKSHVKAFVVTHTHIHSIPLHPCHVSVTQIKQQERKKNISFTDFFCC